MLFVNLDVSELLAFADMEDVVEKELEDAARALTAATNGKLIELANQKLHTRRQPYIDAVSMFQLDEKTFVVNLDASARWIEDGMQEHEMLDNLLKSKKAKRAKDGSTYVVVPFQQNKATRTPAQGSLLATIKKEMASLGSAFPGGTIAPNKLENGPNGKPKLGLIRSMDIKDAPVSTASLRIGRGPLGRVAQGATGGIPLLKGVRVYQKEYKDKKGDTKVGRFVMTFRVASSKQKGGGKWRHPGLEATNLMDDALKWALETWSTKIAPGILEKITASVG